MRGALLVCKKEFMELVKDRKTLFFTFLLPFLLYPLLFGMVGRLSRSDEDKRRAQASRVALVDPEGILGSALREDPKHWKLVARPEGDLSQAIRDERVDLVVEVGAGARQRLERQETLEIRALHDKSEPASRQALGRLREVLERQDSVWIKERLERLGASPQLALPTRVEAVEVGDSGRFVGKMLGSFLPYILMMMMYAGAMQHGIYATAGEKERGTLLNLLATSIPRHQIILGKLLYVFGVGLLTTLVSLASMALSLGHFLSGAVASKGQAAAAGMPNLSAIASPVTLALTFLLMVPLGLLFANLIVLAGIQAKNTVEAGTAIMPGFLVVMVMGVFSLAPGIEKMAFLPYVPVVNVSLAIRKLFSQQGHSGEYLMALAMTLGLAALLTWCSTRLLRRESVVFRT